MRTFARLHLQQGRAVGIHAMVGAPSTRRLGVG